MTRWRSPLAAAIAVLTWLGCSDDPSGPGTPDPDEMILSNPLAPTAAPALASLAGSGAATLTFVSLPPGTVPDARFVVIRNFTSGNEHTAPMVDGGFDPVPVRAEAGDRIELEIHGDGSVLGRKYGTVPSRRPPVIVRTSPPQGRTDVALAVRPTVVFSEPVDPTTLDAVRLLLGSDEVEGQVVSIPTEPWMVEIVPATLLEPDTAYEIDVAQAVLDLDGDMLVAPVRSTFTTGTLAPPPPPPPGPTVTGRIAFVSTRHGGPWIYLANADGSDVVALVSGEAPAWSHDGQVLAFTRGGQLRVINADGSGERFVAGDAYQPSWSPDGTRLAYRTSDRGGWSIHSVDVSGFGDELILAPETLGPEYLIVGEPAWSPDGQCIAFSAHWYADDGVPEIWVMDADGSNPRILEGTGPGADPYTANGSDPTWSPDGTRVAFVPKRWLGGPFAFLVASRLADGTGDLTVHFTSGPGGMMPSPIGEVDWSPDGQSIAFERWSATDVFPHRIRVVDIESGISAQLIPEAPGTGLVQPYYDADVAWSRTSP